MPLCHRLLPATTATTFNARAASATRKKTTVRGPSSLSATFAKKNEPPHRTDSETSRNHSRARMARRRMAVRRDLSAGGQQSRLALGWAEHGQHLEDAGRCGRAAERHAQRLGDLPQ